MDKRTSQASGNSLLPVAASWISSKLGFPTNRFQENRSRAFSEQLFSHMLTAEIARSGKSGSPAVIVTLNIQELQGKDGRLPPLVEDLLFSVLLATLRETDIVGWLRQDETMGVILTEFGKYSRESAAELILTKLKRAIQQSVPSAILAKVSVDVNVLEVPANGTAEAGSAIRELATAANS